jgi:Tfp pilus assembly protein FimT
VAADLLCTAVVVGHPTPGAGFFRTSVLIEEIYRKWDMRKDRLFNERGFTLIELVLLIVVAGILAAVVSVGMGSINNIRLNNAASKILADLRYAQQLAMTTRTRHGLTIRSANVYSLHIDGVAAPLCDGKTCIPDPTNLGQNFVVDFTDYQQGQLSGVTLNPTNPFCGAATIEFNALGAPTDSVGTLLACGTINLTLAFGASTQTIQIQPNTGSMS